MKKLTEDQQVSIAAYVINGIDSIFGDCHKAIGTNSGDITPEQNDRLRRIRLQLIYLISEQVEQNLLP